MSNLLDVVDLSFYTFPIFQSPSFGAMSRRRDFLLSCVAWIGGGGGLSEISNDLRKRRDSGEVGRPGSWDDRRAALGLWRRRKRLGQVGSGATMAMAAAGGGGEKGGHRGRANL